MKPAAFAYHRPDTLDDALALLAEHGDDAKPLAGGQSLVPMMNVRLAQPARLVDLNRLGGLAGIVDDGDALVVGALARHQDVADDERVRERCPMLARAAASIGHYAIRQRGTLGGSLAHADPAAQLPLVAVALGARVDLARRGGVRTLAAGELFVSPMVTALASDELIVRVRFPAAAAHERDGFRLFSRRHGDFAIVAAAVRIAVRDGRIERCRLALGGVGPVPIALDSLADAQRGRTGDRAWAAGVAREAAASIDPPDDARIPAAFRRELVEALLARALGDALAPEDPA